MAALVLAGCGSSDPRFDTRTSYVGDEGGAPSEEGGRLPYDNVSYWEGDGVVGPPHVIIRLGEQRAYFYKGQTLVGISTISTGREGYDTPLGKFHIIQKDKDHVSSRFGDYDDKQGHILMKEIDREKDPMPARGGV